MIMSNLFRGMLVAGSLALISGCMSQRSISTLEANPSAAATLAGMKFRIADLDSKGGYTTNVASLQQGLVLTYPQLFTDEVTAIPLVVRLNSETDNQMAGAIITGLTLGVIPLPAHSGFRMEVGVTPWRLDGAAMPESSIRYKRTDHGWMSIFTPLGLLPVPGRSDIHRKTSLLLSDDQGLEAYTNEQMEFSASELRKAIITALAKSNLDALHQLWTVRQSVPSFAVDIDGRHFEARLTPTFSKGLRQPGGADEYRLFLTLVKAPGSTAATTTYSPLVARKDESGAWQIQRPYLTIASRPTIATALLENGASARGLILTVDNPPIGDFIDTPLGAGSSGLLRWSNGILLHIKNSSLNNELHGLPLGELQYLMTRLESSMLDLNERNGRANDGAQQAIEKGESPEALRELATLYRQRLEILKTITGTVRQEAAMRNGQGTTP